MKPIIKLLWELPTTVGLALIAIYAPEEFWRVTAILLLFGSDFCGTILIRLRQQIDWERNHD